MKKSIFAIMAIATIAMMGCKKTEIELPDANQLVITPLRPAGKPIPNPNYNVDQCKPIEGVQETLESLRYVEGVVPFYYLDYTAKVDWKGLLFPAGSDLDAYGIAKVCDKRDELLYINPTPNKMSDNRESGACSGFITFNPSGDLLFCRNYDNHLDPLAVVFNKNVNAGEHKSVIMTDIALSQSFDYSEEQFTKDNCFLQEGVNLNAALRLPTFGIDGMNDAGLCIATYQLPTFKDEKNPQPEVGENKTERPCPIKQNTGKEQIHYYGLLCLILTQCATVDEVVSFLQSYDYVSIHIPFNFHWFVADANGKYVTLEYWRDEEGKDVLRVIEDSERLNSSFVSHEIIPYAYRSIENYYTNINAALTYTDDAWQNFYSPKVRVTTMMEHYSLVMTEENALRCLQYGNFEIEVPGTPTAWSCVYNAKQKTVIFNMRDDLSKVYSIDLKQDL
ncbi:MAG: linear amide C-N hydrolase [Bacteroidia bacterium]|nr:linear amide C-N hydrolase [Bacteroidia bacterium]